MRLPQAALGISVQTIRRHPCPDSREAVLQERTPETHVIDFRAAEQLLAARDPRGAVKLLDSVIAAHPENTAARLLRARAFFLAAQLRPAELEFQVVLEREPDNAFAHFALARTLERANRSAEAQRHFRLAAALDPRPDYVAAARFDAS
jgi:Flp pilus assembly protein TadD